MERRVREAKKNARKEKLPEIRLKAGERKEDRMENRVYYRFGVAHIELARWFP